MTKIIYTENSDFSDNEDSSESDCDSERSESSLPSSQDETHSEQTEDSADQKIEHVKKEVEPTAVDKLQNILNEWSTKVKDTTISFRLTWHDQIDHNDFREWLQTFEFGCCAPEKGRGKLHYQCIIGGTTKANFDAEFKEYKQAAHWDSKICGNAFHSSSMCRDPLKLLAYCQKEHNEDIIVWGVPECIIDAANMLAFTAISKGDISAEQQLIEEKFLLGATDEEFFVNYLSLWAKYDKNFNTRWLKERWMMLKWRRDPQFKTGLNNKTNQYAIHIR